MNEKSGLRRFWGVPQSVMLAVVLTLTLVGSLFLSDSNVVYTMLFAVAIWTPLIALTGVIARR